jgi:hypothetical protein
LRSIEAEVEEFVSLAGRDSRSAVEEERFSELKWPLSERVMSAPADAVYQLVQSMRNASPRVGMQRADRYSADRCELIG